MLLFDKLKIITRIDYIDNINKDFFIEMTQKGKVIGYKYKHKDFHLMIKTDYIHSELSIEFSSKILKEDFINLINKFTINQCFENINKLGICSIDIDKMLKDEHTIVNKCDVTKDILFENLSCLSSVVKTSIRSNKRWIVEKYNNGIVVRNTASTAKHKKRLVIYDKLKDIQQSNNQKFISTLSNSEFIYQYYKNKIRFEANLNTMCTIRKYLDISNCNIHDVLHSKSNPILSFIDEAVICNTHIHKSTSLKDIERLSLLEKYDFDLSRIEAVIRSTVSKNTSITRAMQPYIRLASEGLQKDNIDIKRLVA